MNATVLVPSKLRDMDLPGPTIVRKTSSASTTSNNHTKSNQVAAVRRIPPALANSDLYSFYMMLNDVKKELLWGTGTGAATAAVQAIVGQTTTLPLGHHTSVNNSNNAVSAAALTNSLSSSNGSLINSGTGITTTTTNTRVLDSRSSPRQSLKQHVRQPSDDSLGSLGGSSTASTSSDPDTDSEADSLMTDRDSVDEHTSHLAAAFRNHLQGLHTILHQLAESADYLSMRYQEDIDAVSM